MGSPGDEVNWSALYHLGPALLALAVVWTGIVYLLAKLEPPVQPAEFGEPCQCGHTFAEHRSLPHGDGSPCTARLGTWGGTTACYCRGFEPPERETVLDPPRSLGGFDVEVFLDPEVDRLAIVPRCRHAAYATTEPGTGQPLKCVDCGQELSE